jgi:hypothetical protein
MKYGSVEYTYAEPIARGLQTNAFFRTWLISRTEFADMSDARLLDSEMKAWRGNSSAEWWRFHFTEKCRCAGCSGKETDILSIFEATSGVRFAIHFEVKHPQDKFEKDGVQSKGYPLRAQCWVTNPPTNVLPHNKASTIFLFSEKKRQKFEAHLACFKTLIIEEVRKAFPSLGVPTPD